MAYLIFSAKGEELGRRALNGPAVIGRSPECDISVRDILLSRRHCRLEQVGSCWTITDLDSKNGIRVGSLRVTSHTLLDGEVIRIGKTSITFRTGAISPAATNDAKPDVSRRPADPWEALAGTVTNFDYEKARLDANARKVRRPHLQLAAAFPTPQPSPPEPDAYGRENIYSMLTEIASSSWDSIYLNASRPSPLRIAPRPSVDGRTPRRPHSPQVDISLQVCSEAKRANAQSVTRSSRYSHPWKRAALWLIKGFATAGQGVMLIGLGHLLRK